MGHPLDEVRKRLTGILDPEDLRRLPKHWERLGDLLLLPLPEVFPEPGSVAEAYASVLRVSAVLRQGRISGELRKPEVQLLWGTDTTTVHQSDGIQYQLDLSAVMWSSGNDTERRRMGEVVQPGEEVLDMFAGVGYFTFPMIVKGGAAQVVAVEKNPDSFFCLQEGARLNRISDRVSGVLGDNREQDFARTFDRIVMGYLPDCSDYVEHALRWVRDGSVLHYHFLGRALREEHEPPHLQRIFEIVLSEGWNASLEHVEEVKTYGPSRSHLVADLRLTS